MSSQQLIVAIDARLALLVPTINIRMEATAKGH